MHLNTYLNRYYLIYLNTVFKYMILDVIEITFLNTKNVFKYIGTLILPITVPMKKIQRSDVAGY